jgi:DNA-binding response OmpR family regulator
MRVLVVEDDEKIASFVVNGLKQSGFAVRAMASRVSIWLPLFLTTPQCWI